MQEEKEGKRLYTEARIAEVAAKNEQLQETLTQLENLLNDTLTVDDYLDLDTLKGEFPDPPPRGIQPVLEKYLPQALSAMQRLIPGAKKKHEAKVTEAKEQFNRDIQVYKNNKKKWNGYIAKKNKEVTEQREEIEQFKKDFAAGEPEAIINYFTLGRSSEIIRHSL